METATVMTNVSTETSQGGGRCHPWSLGKDRLSKLVQWRKSRGPDVQSSFSMDANSFEVLKQVEALPTKYKLEDKPFAEGGFGEIFRASVEGCKGKPVAIKVIDCVTDEEEINDSLLGIVKHEVKVLRKLRSANLLINLIDTWLYKKVAYLAMEYCERGSLKTLLSEKAAEQSSEWGFPNDRIASHVVRSVLLAIKFLHDRQFYHGDIKGDNVLVTQAGQIKLCDFGNTYHVNENREDAHSPGTMYFMAPEIIAEGFSDTKRRSEHFGLPIDVWALGITILELTHLRFPVSPEHEGTSNFFCDIKWKGGKHLGFEEGASLGNTLKAFTMGCLTALPEERPKVADLLRSDIFDKEKTQELEEKWRGFLHI